MMFLTDILILVAVLGLVGFIFFQGFRLLLWPIRAMRARCEERADAELAALQNSLVVSGSEKSPKNTIDSPTSPVL